MALPFPVSTELKHNPNIGSLGRDDRTMGTEWPRLRGEPGVAQYQRLASLLRHRIAKGEYPLGALLPPITQLADDLGVAVVTVRQAYGLLSKEGLIRSRGGIGTRVAALPVVADGRYRTGDERSVRGAAGACVRDTRSPTPDRVPQELLGPDDRSADDYVCVRKLHTFSGEPFCYAEIYVPTQIFESLPRNIARKRKLLAAVLEELGPRCSRVRQRVP